MAAGSTAPQCANITAGGERRRRIAGIASLLAGAIVVAGLASRDAPSLAYAIVFPFAFGAGIGLIQARERTCVALAFRDAAEVDGGGLRRLRAEERGAVRGQAIQVLLKTFVLAGVVTVVAVIVGGLT